MKHIKKLFTLLLIFSISITTCGCSSNTTTNPAAENSDKLTDITLVLDWTPNTNHTGFYVAKHMGYFEDAGLNVSIIQPPEDGATSMVASGQAQFGIDFQDYLAPVFTSEEEMPITAVAALIQHNTSGIISLKEDQITSPSSMEGKKYATWSLPVEQAILKNIVEADGGNYDKVNLIPEYVTDASAALQQDIDAIWVYYAWDGIATELSGLETNFFYFKDITPAFDYYSPVLIANNNFLEANEKTSKAFLDAVRQGYEYAIANPEKAADILCDEVPELDNDLVLESQIWLADQYKAEVKQWGYIDATRWNAFYNWLYENELSEQIPENYGFTNAYLPDR